MKLDLNYPGDYFVFSKNQQRGKVEYAPTRMAEAWLEKPLKVTTLGR